MFWDSTLTQTLYICQSSWVYLKGVLSAVFRWRALLQFLSNSTYKKLKENSCSCSQSRSYDVLRTVTRGSNQCGACESPTGHLKAGDSRSALYCEYSLDRCTAVGCACGTLSECSTDPWRGVDVHSPERCLVQRSSDTCIRDHSSAHASLALGCKPKLERLWHALCVRPLELHSQRPEIASAGETRDAQVPTTLE